MSGIVQMAIIYSRASAGKGYNSPNVIAENTGLFNTSKISMSVHQ